ncbi:hypothetical protein NKR23_g9103 [Pleurostoma richardsiae]|uniref:Uncharacterized protein n=1 Tax=Pleurostoma richardsiae TaxID=41990 RepID=A0AA38VK33_9PEZI|nr:hypothetical protein NKR23_g9103 [Pleurostoma richardsiae]
MGPARPPNTRLGGGEISFPFLELPGEIRNNIYRLALVNGDCECLDQIYNLAPPPLLQTNRRIRQEALSLYYGLNGFLIILPKADNSVRWRRFSRMISCMATGGSLEFVTSLEFVYEVVIHGKDSWFGFELIGGSRRETTKRGKPEWEIWRIGEDGLDWDDRRLVEAAHDEALKRVSCRYFRDLIGKLTPVSRIVKVLFEVAKHCDRGNKYVELIWESLCLPPDDLDLDF